jgi:hypothetical protein
MGASAARRTSRLASAIRSIHAAPAPGRLEIEQGVVGGAPERVARRHPARQALQVPERRRQHHEPRQGRRHPAPDRRVVRVRAIAVVPVLVDRGVPGAERPGPHEHGRAGIPARGQERLHRVRVAQERRGRGGRPRLQEHPAPLAEREPEGRAGADLDEVDARDAGATHRGAAVLVDARRDRRRVVRAEDRAREEAVLRVAQGTKDRRRQGLAHRHR